MFDTMASLMKVPRWKQLSDLPAALINWERAQRTFSERTGGQGIPTEWKLPILFDTIPLSMMSEIEIKHKYNSGMDKTYEGFSKLLVEMAYEKNYDRRAAKSLGDTDMDVDALAAEKEERQQQHAARQAELEAEDHRDYGEDVEYTAEERVEYEKGLQDELNRLGTRGGKQGKGKGKNGKGKGKDRNAKGTGYGGGQWQGKGKGAGCT